MVPLNIRFDGVPNVFHSPIVRMPKLYEGAPYRFGFKIRFEDDTYRNFGGIPDMRWRIKLRPSDDADLMVLYASRGNFEITTDLHPNDQLNFVVKASDWENVELPKSPNHMEMDVPFSFVVEFLDEGGVVTERFAQGSGLISVSLVD
jgi:hypothetical protein